MSVENKRVFKVEVDGKEVEFAVLKPSNKVKEKADVVYNGAFHEAVKPKDGSRGAIVRASLDQVLRDNGLWDDASDKKFKELNQRILDGEKRLKQGGGKLEDAKAVAVQMRRDRAELFQLTLEQRKLDLHTAEAQAENARFNYLVSCCTVYNEGDKAGKLRWKDYQAYLDADDGVAAAAAENFGRLVYGTDPEFESKLPENAFLKKYKFCDDKLRLVNQQGKWVDVDGRLVDEQGYYVNEKGERVDKDGQRVDKDGEYIFEFQPFLDENGKEVVVN